MAYDPQQLSVLAYANGFTLWHYAANTEAMDSVLRGGYFDAARDMLRVGDMLLASTVEIGGPRAGVLLVTHNNGHDVEVTNLTPVPSC